MPPSSPHRHARTRRAHAHPYAGLTPPASPRRNQDRRKRVLAVRTFAGATAWLDGQPVWQDGRVAWRSERETLAPTPEDLSLAQRRLNKIARYRYAAAQALEDAAGLVARRRARLERAKRLGSVAAADLEGIAARARTGDGEALDRLAALLVVEAQCSGPLPVSPAAVLAACGGRALAPVAALATSRQEERRVRALASLVLGALDRRSAATGDASARWPLETDADRLARSAYLWGRHEGLSAEPGVAARLLALGVPGATAQRFLGAIARLQYVVISASRLVDLLEQGGGASAIEGLADAALEADAVVEQARQRERVAQTLPPGNARKRKRLKQLSAREAERSWIALRDAALEQDREHARAAGELATALTGYAERGPVALGDAARFARQMVGLGRWRLTLVEAATQALARGLELNGELAAVYVSLLVAEHDKWWPHAKATSVSSEADARHWLTARQRREVEAAFRLVEALRDPALIREASDLDVVLDLAHADLPGAAHYRYALQLVRRLDRDGLRGFSLRWVMRELLAEDLPVVFEPLVAAAQTAPEGLRGHLFDDAVSELPDARRAILAETPLLAHYVRQVALILEPDEAHCPYGPCLRAAMVISRRVRDEDEARRWVDWVFQLARRQRGEKRDDRDPYRIVDTVKLALALSGGSIERFRLVLPAALRHDVFHRRQEWLEEGIKTLDRLPQLRGVAEALGDAFPQRPHRCTRVLEWLWGISKLGTSAVEELASLPAREKAPPIAGDSLLARWRGLLEAAPRLAPDAAAYVLARQIAGRGDDVPAGVRRALAQDETRAAELRYLESRLEREPQRADLAARAATLRARLENAEAVRGAAVREAEERLAQAVTDARLEAVEQVLARRLRGRAAELSGADTNLADLEELDDTLVNAVLLASDVKANRRLLRKLLRARLNGDVSWQVRHPGNVAFLERAASAGLNVREWLRRQPRAYRLADVPGGTVHVWLENDPLNVLQMGTLFGTCLSAGGGNSFAAVANACELNKRVVYARDARGRIIGRKLIGITTRGRLVGFQTYTALDWNKGGTALDGVLVRYCRAVAERCGLRLADKGRVPKLFVQSWYDDGVVPWGEQGEPEADRAASPAAA